MSLIIPKVCNMGGTQGGLVGTIGLTLYNPDGSVHTARATTGIYEIGINTGCYGKNVTFPDDWKGSLKWDTGGGSPVYATEDYEMEGMIQEIKTETDKIQTIDNNVNRVLEATEIGRGAVNDPAASTTGFITTLTETANAFWSRNALVFTSGQNKGQIRKIHGYTGATKTITLYTELSYVPADGDTFVIIAARNFRINIADKTEIVDEIWDEPIAGHIDPLNFGGKNQKVVPSETITDYQDKMSEADLHTGLDNYTGKDDYKADVSALALEATSQTIKDLLENGSYGLSALQTLLDAIDTSTELQNRFDEIKGVGWTDETLKAIKDAIDTAGVKDWTDNEIKQIRDALGVTGIKTTAVGGQVQEIKTETDKIQIDIINVPDNYKADISALALEATSQTIKDLLENGVYGLSALQTLLDGIDTSTEMQARFDEIKGAGWTDETLKAIKEAIGNENQLDEFRTFHYLSNKNVDYVEIKYGSIASPIATFKISFTYDAENKVSSMDVEKI